MFFEEGQSAFITTHDEARFCTTEHNDIIVENFGFSSGLTGELHGTAFPYPYAEKEDHECNERNGRLPWICRFCHPEYSTHLHFEIQ